MARSDTLDNLSEGALREQPLISAAASFFRYLPGGRARHCL